VESLHIYRQKIETSILIRFQCVVQFSKGRDEKREEEIDQKKERKKQSIQSFFTILREGERERECVY
jgi:hypothetical protein